MIERYTRDAIGAVWSEQAKFDSWLEVELAVSDALFARGRDPGRRPTPCTERAAFTVEAVKEREKITNHDVAAFVDVVASSVGEAGRWIHYGLTSTDVLDTALAMQITKAGEIVVAGARDYRDALVARALEHSETRSASAAPTASTPSRPPSACSSPASPSRRDRNVDAARAGLRAVLASASSPARSAPTRHRSRRSRPR